METHFGYGVDYYAIRVKSYNPLLWMVARIFFVQQAERGFATLQLGGRYYRSTKNLVLNILWCRVWNYIAKGGERSAASDS